MAETITVALAGNPNSGKTTVFNAMTGARQHVGNYPGVTVEKVEGTRRHAGAQLRIVDLPGTYSLTAYSIEELVARNFIIHERPDVVVVVLDTSNLERNLYLAVQIIELGAPLVLAFNMSDVAKARGMEFDLERLSRLLGAPIVRTVGNKGIGIDALLDQIVEAKRDEALRLPAPHIDYGPEVEAELETLMGLLASSPAPLARERLRWTAVKLLENDTEVRDLVASPAIDEATQKSVAYIQGIIGDLPEIVIADRRYGFISGACLETVRRSVEARHNMSDRIDAVVTNRALAIPIFLVLMYATFQLTFTLGAVPMGWIEAGVGWLSGAISALWPDGSQSALRSLIVDGIIGGVGGVMVFLPNILMLFLAIAVLEDSGYMARAAFVMDQLMHRIGLHGKSFIPMLIGFGCSVPAIMATRMLENQRDRLTTMLIVPLMSCGARLPIYALIIPAFFPAHWRAPMLWIIYCIGIALAIGLARVLRLTLLRGESIPFVMELPPYRMPTLKGLLIHMWTRGWLYVKKAGTVILGISILLWAATTYPQKTDFDRDYAGEWATALAANNREKAIEVEQARQGEALAYSLAGRIGRGLEPALRPMGFDWRIGTALIGAFAAKEVFVAQLGIVFAVGEADAKSDTLRAKLRANYSPLVGFCIMLFCLIGTPCMATIAVTRRESNSWKWALLQLGGLTALAWALTVTVYQVGHLCGLAA